MVASFIGHELKAFWRSKNTGKSIAIRVTLGFFILYFLISALLAGFGLRKILEYQFPNDDVVKSFCGIILLYFLFDVIMRLQLQELPTLRVQPYLHLPVKRNFLVRYLALSAVLSAFNIWPFILFLPFVFTVIATDSGPMVTWAFVIAITGLTVFNNYLALYLKRKSNLNGWVFLISIAVLIFLAVCDFKWHLFSTRNISYAYFGRLLTTPALAALPLLLGAAMYYLNFAYLKLNLYLEDLNAHKVKSYKSSTDIPFLSRFGSVGDLAANEIKLILRNKRPRSSLVMGLFFIGYGFFMYSTSIYGDGFKIFISMFMTGIFIINYGQFMHSWQASHFDGLLVCNINFTDFIKGKYLLFTTISTLILILSTSYIYFGWHVLLVNFVMYVWNIGVNTTMVLFFANRNFKRIDLSKGAAMNWEGVGATQWILSLPLMIAPFIIYGPLALLKHPDIGLALLALIGLLGVLTRNFWIKQLEADYYTKRYQIAEGFRNK